MTNQVVLPEQGNTKFVQFYIDELPLLRFGSTRLKHGRILAQELTKNNIQFQVDSEHETPVLRGERYRVAGMGVCEYFGKGIHFYGYSQDYGLGPNREHIEAIKHLLGDLEIKVSSPE